MKRIKCILLSLVIGMVLGLWFGFNMGMDRPLLSNPFEESSFEEKIRQTGGTQSDVPLTAEVYTIGRKIHTGVYLIIDVVKQDFSFAENRLFEFTTRGYPLGFTEGNINVGARYETFLVVVADKDGNILETRSGRSIRDEGIDFIRTLGPRTLFDRDGNVIGEIDDKNQSFRSAAPAAVQ